MQFIFYIVLFTDRPLSKTERRRPATFKQVASVVYKDIVKFLDFDDIKSLVTALNLQFTKFDYDTLILIHEDKTDFVQKHKKYFIYLRLLIFQYVKLKFNKNVKHIELKVAHTDFTPNMNHLLNLQSLVITNNQKSHISKIFPPNLLGWC